MIAERKQQLHALDAVGLEKLMGTLRAERHWHGTYVAQSRMAKIDATKVWALNYRLVTSVIVEVAPALRELGIEVKELFLLAELDAHPHPAALAEALLLPKPSVTVYVKRLAAAGFVKREIDSADLRRHKLTLTVDGRKAMTRGLALLADEFGGRLGRLSAAQQAELKAMLEKLTPSR